MTSRFSHRLAVLIATGAYVGYIPPAPGTLGSLLGLFLLWPLGPGMAQILVTLLLVGVGFAVAGQAAKVMEARDPPAIIIDEIAGIAVATALLPARLAVWAVAFVLFRVFDIVKPFPARQVEGLSGALGIVADDLIAGVYANLLVRLWLFIA